MFSNHIPVIEETRKAYKNALTAFDEELQTKVNFYNTIVKNLANKFNSPLTPNTFIVSVLSFPFTAENFVRENPSTVVFYNKNRGQNQTIPKYLFHNDPMIIAQHVRHQIREMQVAERENALRDAEKSLTQARHNRERAENQEKAFKQIADENRRLLMRKTWKGGK